MDTLSKIETLPVLLNRLPWQHLATAIVVYFTSLIFYRLFFHPLAGFPGPKLAAITRYVEGYYDVVLGGQYTWKIAEMHKKYGEYLLGKILVRTHADKKRPNRPNQPIRAACRRSSPL